MNLTYEVFVRHEVYLALTQIEDSRRSRILDFIESLSRHPFQEGDGFVNDAQERCCHIKIIDKHALCFWPDHAEKEIRVVDLIDEDRGV